MEIIHLHPDDWRLYRAIRLEALQDSPQAFGSTLAETQARPDGFWQTRLADTAAGVGTCLLFARQADTLVGLIGAMRDHEDRAMAWVISVYVAPAARGQGVGYALMQAVLAELSAAGIRKARLLVNPRQTAAVRVYEKSGFVPVGSLHARMGDGSECEEMVMERPLTP